MGIGDKLHNTEVEMTEQLMSTQRTITATEVRRNFGAVVRRLRQHHEHAIIQSSGTPIAVLLPLSEYEQLLRYKRLAVFDQITRELGQEVERRGLSEEELMSELEETKREVFLEQYGRLDYRKWSDMPEMKDDQPE
jgi:prevent-host-death family protein